MIPDKQTNSVFLADKLLENHPNFARKLEYLFQETEIPYEYLHGTRDPWAVDFMPVQVDEKEFVQFNFNPDYLREYPAQRTRSSEIKAILDTLKQDHEKLSDIEIKESDLIVDGGNVVRSENKVILCDKVFHENECFQQEHINHLIKKLKDLFKVDDLIFVPWDMEDYSGHADAMVRFIDDEKVLINEYSHDADDYAQVSLRTALHNAGLTIHELPCFLPDDPFKISARGLYLNYLEMEHAILMPAFNLQSDQDAYEKLNEQFKKPIFQIDCSEIAREGGILNCLTWNIKAP